MTNLLNSLPMVTIVLSLLYLDDDDDVVMILQLIMSHNNFDLATVDTVTDILVVDARDVEVHILPST